jgi:hypothetical protein
MAAGAYSEEELERIERSADATAIPALVQAVRSHQRDLDNLRLSMDVARRDREELRLALLQAQGELKRLKEKGE